MLVRQFLRDYLWVGVGFYVILQLSLLPAILFWPDFRDNIPAIAKLIPIDSLRDMIEAIEEGGYWAYFAGQHFFKGVNLFGLAAVAFFATGMVAREADNRTAEFLLSRPVTRARILMVRWATGAALLAVPVYLSSLGGYFLSGLIDENLRLGAVLAAATYLNLFLLALYTVTVWLSACSVHQLKAAILIVALGLFQFGLYMVKTVGDYSLFQLVDVRRLMLFGGGQVAQFPLIEAGGLVAGTLVFLGLALRAFEKRDF